MTNEAAWLRVARDCVGVAEIPGPGNSPVIASWLRRLRAWWVDDDTPWCGTFVAHCMDSAGVALPEHWYRARAWLDWGVDVGRPYVGSVVVLKRGPSMGHVGFVVGWRGSHLAVLGGNQANAVNVATFAADRILGYRWPSGEPLPALLAEQLADDVPASRGEA